MALEDVQVESEIKTRDDYDDKELFRMSDTYNHVCMRRTGALRLRVQSPRDRSSVYRGWLTD